MSWLQGIACWEVYTGVPRITRGNEFGANGTYRISYKDCTHDFKIHLNVTFKIDKFSEYAFS